MSNDPTKELTAALLTVSEGLDAVYQAMRQTLSFQVDQHNNKLTDDFIPPRMDNTAQRFQKWQDQIGETKE